MKKYYTDEKQTQVLISLLKEHKIRKVIVSPGSTNVSFVASIQHDPYFEKYSSVDERSAAYMACGLAAETDEPVVISCTGATASRNYLPALTEAYYRKLPILAVTSTQAVCRVGQNIAQVIDRSLQPKDAFRHSVTLPIIKDGEDLWECEVKVNGAILELRRHGGGPVHINLPTSYSQMFDVKTLPKCRVIKRVTIHDNFPELPAGRIAVFVGSHRKWSIAETEALDQFCAHNNAVVFCDHTSNYKGKFRVLNSLVSGQRAFDYANCPETMIQIGEMSGDYYGTEICKGSNIWRVNEDGEIRDQFRKLTYVFEMPEKAFFDYYAKHGRRPGTAYLEDCSARLTRLRRQIPSQIPFSNVWVASQIAHRIPDGSVIHFGILNSLRSWNFFELPLSVLSASNVGGFGIDGGVSSLIGASLADRNRLYYAVVGDLAFFYDMNVLGNRHVGRNVRILLVNNGKGTEFTQFGHQNSHFGRDADDYISAAGHFGRQSKTLVRHYAEDLGFEYLNASNKEEFSQVCNRFLTPSVTEKPMLFEIFTKSEEESRALEVLLTLDGNVSGSAKGFVKNTSKSLKRMARRLLGEKSFGVIKNAVKSLGSS